VKVKYEGPIARIILVHRKAVLECLKPFVENELKLLKFQCPKAKYYIISDPEGQGNPK